MEMPMSMSMPYGRWQMDKADKRLVHRAVSCVKGRGAQQGHSRGTAGDRIHIRVQALFMFANISPPSHFDCMFFIIYLSIHSVKYCLSLRDSLTGFQLDFSWDSKSPRVNERMRM